MTNEIQCPECGAKYEAGRKCPFAAASWHEQYGAVYRPEEDDEAA